MSASAAADTDVPPGVDSSRRLARVLLSAYACEPGVGSEGGIGWSWARQVALRNDCVLVTRENNVDAVRAAVEREGLERLQVVGFDLPYWMRFWKRKQRGAMAYFYLWQLGLASVARRLDREHDFDLVQHLTFASSWIPSGLAFAGKPFVWGPVGQHPRIPARFLVGSPLRARVAESLKAAVKRVAQTLDPFLRYTVRRAARVLSLGSEFENRTGLLGSAQVVRLPACGVDEVGWGEKRGTRVLFSGRLVPLKGPELALKAFAKARAHHPELCMTFLGEGPLRGSLEQEAQRLGLADAIRFAGHLSHAEALREMSAADVFLFPSFEGAGMVVPEAMARGAVVLCLDFGGPADMVAAGRGLAVPLGLDVEETTDHLAAGLRRLLEEPELTRGLRSEAEAWIRREMLWDRKGERLQDVYGAVLREAGRGSS